MKLIDLFSQDQFHDVVSNFHSLYSSPDQAPLEANILAAAYFRLGDYQAAYDVLAQIESALHDDPDYLSLFGTTCRRLGKFDMAETLFDRAISLNPDSLVYKNNYSNLLIDQSRFDEAIEILQSITSKDPDYHDARQNLNRALYAKSHQVSKPSDQQANTSTSNTLLHNWQDPLSLAFATDEVQKFGRIKSQLPTVKKQINKDLSDFPSPPSQDVSSEYTKLAIKAVSDKNPSQALSICSKVHNLGPLVPSTYKICSDSYIGLKSFFEAEICLLTSILLSSPNSDNYLNLVSFASMRGDMKLAQYYLEKAASLEPDNPNLKKVQAMLNKNISNSPSYQFDISWSPKLVKDA